MEYHCNKDDTSTGVASRIFEKGLEIYGDEIEFVLRYLGFLISVNAIFLRLPIAMFTCSLLLRSDARALFEQVITTLPPERARPLWER